MKLPSSAQGERLDRAIHRSLEGQSVASSVREVREALRDGRIRVNQRRAAPGGRVAGGEDVDLSGFRPRRSAKVRAEPDLRAMAPVLEDWPDILALNKPSGWACAPLRAVETGTLLAAAIAYHPAIVDAGPPLEGGLAHRLDIGTSGVVLFGKTLEARVQLRTWFSAHAVEKRYVAVVSPPSVDLPSTLVAPIRSSGPRVRVEETPQALEARSDFELVAQSADAWLVGVRTFFGRRHQVRAHLAEVGAAIHGDIQYGGRDASRLMLHASRIDLPDGRSVVAPIPPSFGFHGEVLAIDRAHRDGGERVRRRDPGSQTP